MGAMFFAFFMFLLIVFGFIIFIITQIIRAVKNKYIKYILKLIRALVIGLLVSWFVYLIYDGIISSIYPITNLGIYLGIYFVIVNTVGILVYILYKKCFHLLTDDEHMNKCIRINEFFLYFNLLFIPSPLLSFLFTLFKL